MAIPQSRTGMAVNRWGPVFQCCQLAELPMQQQGFRITGHQEGSFGCDSGYEVDMWPARIAHDTSGLRLSRVIEKPISISRA